jgi:hypothetical protein
VGEIPIGDRAIRKRIALLEIDDRGGIQSIVGELSRVTLEIAREDFEFAENAEGAIVLPVGQLDPIGAAILMKRIDLFGEVLDMGWSELGIH